MKTRTCDVAIEHPRMDILYDGIVFRGATLWGQGGIMGGGDNWGWFDIPTRFAMLQAHGEMLRVYTVHSGEKREFFDAPASKCALLALYGPHYRR